MTDPTLTRDEAVPTGWKLVPIEPTPEMMAAGYMALLALGKRETAEQWKAMLASAPAGVDAGLTALLENLEDSWSALRLIRETVETIGPVGSMPSEEHVCCAVAPTHMAEAEAIVAGIQKIASLSPAATLSKQP